MQVNIYGAQEITIVDQVRRRKPNLLLDVDRLRLAVSFRNDFQHDALGIKLQIRLGHIKMTEASGLTDTELRESMASSRVRTASSRVPKVTIETPKGMSRQSSLLDQ